MDIKLFEKMDPGSKPVQLHQTSNLINSQNLMSLLCCMSLLSLMSWTLMINFHWTNLLLATNCCYCLSLASSCCCCRVSTGLQTSFFFPLISDHHRSCSPVLENLCQRQSFLRYYKHIKHWGLIMFTQLTLHREACMLPLVTQSVMEPGKPAIRNETSRIKKKKYIMV